MKPRNILLFILACLLVLIVSAFGDYFSEGKLKIIACDVGQGDGFLIVTPGGKQIVLDGGAGNKIMDCLGANMPYWDRTVEMVMATHTDRDHMEGLIGVLENYYVDTVAATGFGGETKLFGEWKRVVTAEEGAKIYKPKAGDKVILDSVELDILWPSTESYDTWEKAIPSDNNVTSIVMKLIYGDFCAYFTGDQTWENLESVVSGQCELLQVSHHGSKTGTSDVLVKKIKPKISIIQVGKNSYGHPHQEVLEMLTSNNVKILRSDINGIIEIETDGKTIAIL